MSVSVKKVTVYKCERCEHEWIPRDALSEKVPGDPKGLPKVCPNPKCKSPYWAKPRAKKARN